MSLALTRTIEVQTALDTQYGKNNIRRSRYGVYDLFQNQTASPNSFLSAEVKAELVNSMGHSVVVPMFDTQNVTLGNVRSCVITNNENVAVSTTVTFATIQFGFKMYPARHKGNKVSYQADFQQKMNKFILKVLNTYDDMGISNLEINKNQVWTNAPYPVVGNALQVGKNQKVDLYNQLSPFMETMDFYSVGLDIAANTSHIADVRRLMAQGPANDVNQAFQFGGYNYWYSNRILNRAVVSPAPPITATGYAVADGNLAVINRNDPDSVAGHTTRSGKEWGLTPMPLLNQVWGTYYTDDCEDASALHAGTSHLTATKAEGYSFHTDVAFVSSYNGAPATRPNPIVKFEISSADA